MYERRYQVCIDTVQIAVHKGLIYCVFCRHFASDIDLSTMPVDVALRRFQSFLRMPGEAQKIERIMESFSRRFGACNPHVT